MIKDNTIRFQYGKIDFANNTIRYLIDKRKCDLKDIEFTFEKYESDKNYYCLKIAKINTNSEYNKAKGNNFKLNCNNIETCHFQTNSTTICKYMVSIGMEYGLYETQEIKVVNGSGKCEKILLLKKMV